MTLNEKQKEAVINIDSFIGSDQKEYLLTGRAGTGKTTTVQYINTRDYTVIGMALSHKAKEVLRESLKTRCITIAAATGKDKVDDLETGESYFINFGKAIVYDKILFIVDECSMITFEDRELLKELYPKAKFLYLGDKHQLPPINSVRSIFEDSLDNVELLDNMRTGTESPIMTLLNNIIQLQKQAERLNNVRIEDVINVLPTEHIETEDRTIYRNLPISQFYNKYGDSILLTYHVRKKEAMNIKFREAVLNFKEKYEPNEKLIFNNSIFKDDIRIYTNSEIVTVNTVHSAMYEFKTFLETSKEKIEIKLEMPYYVLYTHEQPLEPIFVPSNIEEVQRTLTRIKTIAVSEPDIKKRKRIFVNFYRLQAAFYDVSYAYAITSHKSQGSTYPYVIVDAKDILHSNMSMLDKLKCLYVALSRAKYALNVIY